MAPILLRYNKPARLERIRLDGSFLGQWAAICDNL